VCSSFSIGALPGLPLPPVIAATPVACTQGAYCEDSTATVDVGESTDFVSFASDFVGQVPVWQQDVAVPVAGPGPSIVQLTLTNKYGLSGKTSVVVSVEWPPLLLVLEVERTLEGVRVIASFDEVGPDSDLVPYLWALNDTQWDVVGPTGAPFPHTCGLSSTCWLFNVTGLGTYNISATVRLVADAWAAVPSYDCATCVHTANAVYNRVQLTVAAAVTLAVGGATINCAGTLGGAKDLSDLAFGFEVLWPPSAEVEPTGNGTADVTGLVLGQGLVRVLLLLMVKSLRLVGEVGPSAVVEWVVALGGGSVCEGEGGLVCHRV
jgi:hypothetical protein